MSKNKLAFYTILCLVMGSCREKPVQPSADVPKITMIDAAMAEIVDSTASIEVLAEGFNWSEGPLWLSAQNMLIFTDVPENTVYSWDEKNGKQVYLKPSGYTLITGTEKREGANGLALDPQGRLVLCQHGNRRVARMEAPLESPQDTFSWLAASYKGKKLNSPNDLQIMADGEIFFTDPPYGLPGGDQDTAKALRFNGVYRLGVNGEVILLDSLLTRPNGIILTPDARTMIVANSDPEKAIWMKYTLDENRKVTDRTLWADKTDLVKAGKKGLPDGLKLSRKGHVFATGPGGVLVFSLDGKWLGTIETGQATANCALDAEEKYLYMTADDYLMRVRLR